MAASSHVKESISAQVDEPGHHRGGMLGLGVHGLGVTCHVDAGRTLVVEGDPIDHYFLIVSGTVRLYKAVADGRRQIIDFLGAKDRFGLTGLADHAYSVEAITDVVMIRYPRHGIESAIERAPDLGQQLFRLACTELDKAQRRMLLLGRKSAEERVASFLMDLAFRNEAGRRESERREAGGEGRAFEPCMPPKTVLSVELAMSRQDIADYLGLTVETVSRLLNRFKRAGLIDLPDRSHVILNDASQLAGLAAGDPIA